MNNEEDSKESAPSLKGEAAEEEHSLQEDRKLPATIRKRKRGDEREEAEEDENIKSCSTSKRQRLTKNEEREYAPDLETYLMDNATLKYIPRPEWCSVPCTASASILFSRSIVQPWPAAAAAAAAAAGQEGVPNRVPPMAMPQIAADAESLLRMRQQQQQRPWALFQQNREAAEAFAVMGAAFVAINAGMAAVAANSTGGGRAGVQQQGEGVAVGGGVKREGEGSFFMDSEYNTALHVATRAGATQQALELIKFGAPVDFPNIKGVTPLATASQRGVLPVVKALLEKGADPLLTSQTGSTPLIQACHFGHLNIVRLLLNHGALVDQANYKSTTALMRAAQEGHHGIVSLLLQNNADVNSKNAEQMSSLMLASQRGHTHIVKILIESGAAIDAKTAQHSTSLMLACKRGNYDVAKILVAAGAELCLRDHKGRTARDTALRKANAKLVQILCPIVQIDLMKHFIRVKRNYLFARLWTLLQHERCTVKINNSHQTIHDVSSTNISPYHSPSQKALILTMTLPQPLMELVASYVPLPNLWEKRLDALTNRCHIDPDATIHSVLDFIDEVLAEAGYIDILHSKSIPPTPPFTTWKEWESWGRNCDNSLDITRMADLDHQDHSLFLLSDDEDDDEIGDDDNETASTNDDDDILDLEDDLRIDHPAFHDLGHDIDFPAPRPRVERQNQPPPRRRRRRRNRRPEEDDTLEDHPPTYSCTLELRRKANFLQILSSHYSELSCVLTSPPYNMSQSLLKRLKRNSDIQSTVRRMSKWIHFEVGVAVEMVMLANELVVWFWQQRDLDKGGGSGTSL